MKSVDSGTIIRHTYLMRTKTAKKGTLMAKTITTDTTMEFTIAETDYLATEFGTDAEYYEQYGITWAVQITDEEVGGYGMPEVWAISRVDGKLAPAQPEHDFDWESAEAFRGSEFPQADYS